jgi:hypothetical protein
MKCEFCGEDFKPFLPSQRFCCRDCSDEWFRQERREAIDWFRECGMKPHTKANQAKANQSERAA